MPTSSRSGQTIVVDRLAQVEFRGSAVPILHQRSGGERY